LTQQNITVRPQKILFVCSRNEIRSLTAERMLDGIEGYQVRSAGTEAGARVRVTKGQIGWADTVFVMEKRHRERLMQKFGQAMEGKQIVCLHIPDEYGYMDEALIEVLRSRLEGYICFPA
jgi:predicted protein tyrosine phosphatase